MNTNLLNVTKHLTEREYQQLITTHTKHSKFMDKKTKAKYSLENIKCVERSSEEPGILEVHWPDQWWHYTPNNQWY